VEGLSLEVLVSSSRDVFMIHDVGIVKPFLSGVIAPHAEIAYTLVQVQSSVLVVVWQVVAPNRL